MKKLKYLFLFLLVVVLGVVSAVITYRILNHSKADKNAVSIRETEKNESVHAENIIIPCIDTITFKSNQKEQHVEFYNPTKNEGINFTVILSVDGKEIYKSGIIESGKAVYDISINEEMDNGIYNATLTYQCTDDNNNALNGANVNTTIIVE